MGHCEMLLAVAGLNENAIRTRTKQLADGDWQPRFRGFREQARWALER